MISDIDALKLYHRGRIEFWQITSNDTLKPEVKQMIITFHQEQLKRVTDFDDKLLQDAKS